MKPKTMILAVVAVGCGLVASYLTNQLLAQRNAQPIEEPMVKILVAKQKIGAFLPIREPEKAFALVDYPERIAPKKALKEFDKLKDQRLNKPLDPDKPVTEDDLLSKDMAMLSAQMKPGERAVAIRVNPECLAGGFVLQGSRVDVMCTMRSADTTTKVVLQNMLVLAIDTQAIRNPEQPSILGQTVTLAAKPEEAARLALASSVGELRLTLRPMGDEKPLGQVVARVGDFDNPIKQSSNENGEGAESAEGSRSAPALPPTGSVPMAEEDKDPKEKNTPKAETPPPVVETPKEKPIKRHKLTIYNGANKETTVFPDKSEDEEEGGNRRGESRDEGKKSGKKEV